MDLAVAEVADEQRVAQRAEVARCERQPPRRIQLAGVCDEALHERAIRIEDIHHA